MWAKTGLLLTENIEYLAFASGFLVEGMKVYQICEVWVQKLTLFWEESSKQIHARIEGLTKTDWEIN